MTFILSASLRVLPDVSSLRATKAALARSLGHVSVPISISTGVARRELARLRADSTAALTAGNRLSASYAGAAKASSSFGNAVALAGRRLLAYAAGGLSVVMVMHKLIAAWKESTELQTRMAKIEMITGTSKAELASMSAEVRRVGIAFGASSKDIAQASQILATAGWSAEKVKDAMGLIAQTSVGATFGDVADTADSLIVLEKVFGQTKIDEYAESLNAINRLSKRYAVESKSIIETLKRAGSAFDNAQMSAQQLFAVMTSLKQATRETDETLATSLKMLVTRMARPRTISALKGFGIESIDSGKLRSTYDVLTEMANLINKKPRGDSSINQLLEIVAGSRHVSKLIALLCSWNVTQEALNVAQEKGNELLKDSAIHSATLAGSWERLRQKFGSLTDELIRGKGIGAFMFGVESSIDVITRFGKTISSIIPLLITMAAIRFTGLPAMMGRVNLTGPAVGFGGVAPGSTGRALSDHEMALRQNIKMLNRQSYVMAQMTNTFGPGIARVLSPLSAFPNALIRASSALSRFTQFIGTHLKSTMLGMGMVGLMGFAQTKSSETPLGQGAMTGGTMLLAWGMMTKSVSVLGAVVNATAGAFMALGIGVSRYSEALESERLKLLSQQMEHQQVSTRSLITQTNDVTHPLALKQFAAQFAEIMRQHQNVNDLNSISHITKYMRAANTFTSPDKAAQSIQAENFQTFRAAIKSNLPELVQLRDKIIETVNSYDEFLAYGDGIGRQLLIVADVVDDGVMNMSSAFEQIVKEKLAEKVAAASKEDIRSLSPITISSKEILGRIPDSLIPTIAEQFEGIGMLGSAAFSDVIRRLDLTDAEKQLGMNINRAYSVLPEALRNVTLDDATFREEIVEALDMAGVSSAVIAGIEQNLEDMTLDDLQKKMSNLDGLVDGLMSETDSTVSALKSLSDATVKLREAQLANIRTYYGQLNTFSDAMSRVSAIDDMMAERRGFGSVPVSSNQRVLEDVERLTGTSDVGVLAERLRRANDELKKTGDLRLSSKIDNTKTALSKLADASARLTTITQERIAAENKLQGNLSFAEGYATDPMGTIRGLRAAQTAYNVGLEKMPAPMREQALQALSQAENVELFGTGLTGGQIKENLLMNFADKMGVPIEALIQNVMSAKQQEQAILESSRQAAVTLAQYERMTLDGFVARLGAENMRFLSGLHSALTGGIVSASSPSTTAIVGMNPDIVNSFAMATQTFNNSVNSLSQTIGAMPHEVVCTHTIRPVEINITGAQAIANITPNLREMITGEINAAISKTMKQYFPDVLTG